MGDDIQKAFRNVDDILESMDLEASEAAALRHLPAPQVRQYQWHIRFLTISGWLLSSSSAGLLLNVVLQ